MKDHKIPLMRPTLAEWPTVAERFREIYESGDLTLGKYTRALEERAASLFGAERAVALSSCTAGLLLVLRALGLKGEVIMPSFTWASTGHAAVWNNLTPVFADCERGTYTLDPEEARRLVTPQTCAVMAVNIFGLYPDMDGLRAVCREAGVPFLCDSAQGAGATYKGRISGTLADAEIFSMSPTKVVTAVEGGIVTTNDPRLADAVRGMRDYGKTPDGSDIEAFGLSARISEFHAVIGLSSFERMSELIAGRERIFRRYHEGLKGVPGIEMQELPPDRTTTGNYFILFADPAVCPRERLAERLAAQGIATKRYFHPPLHKQAAYAGFAPPRRPLPVTEAASARGLAVPIFTHMDLETVDRVVDAVRDAMTRR